VQQELIADRTCRSDGHTAARDDVATRADLDADACPDAHARIRAVRRERRSRRRQRLPRFAQRHVHDDDSGRSHRDLDLGQRLPLDDAMMTGMVVVNP
jgi:hypothetical protein